MDRPWKKSFKVSLVVQTISYIIMMVVYSIASNASLLTEVEVVKPGEFRFPETIEIFYIDPADGDVYRRSIQGGAAQKIYELNSTSRMDMLSTSPATHAASTELKAWIHSRKESIAIIPDLRVRHIAISEQPEVTSIGMNDGRSAKLDVPAGTAWDFSTGFGNRGGLSATHRQTNERFEVSMEAPFLVWHARNAVHLPGDLALFQLGENQICVFDPATRRIALLWHARGFVAVIPRK
jgi:hypothetical protein